LAARAAAFAAAESYGEAEADFTAALALAPLDAHGYVGRAAAWRRLNALAKGLDDANRALLIDGSLVAAYGAGRHPRSPGATRQCENCGMRRPQGAWSIGIGPSRVHAEASASSHCASRK
jgi:hypothetical protein